MAFQVKDLEVINEDGDFIGTSVKTQGIEGTALKVGSLTYPTNGAQEGLYFNIR